MAGGKENQRKLLDSEQSKQRAPPKDFLDTVLVQLSEKDFLTIRDSLEGIFTAGATGAGKTSGTAAAIMKAFLRAQYGGLVCCTKPEDRELIEKYCAETGRTDSLVIFSPEQPHSFNFLNYELNRKGRGAGQVENLVALFSYIIEIVEGKVGQQGKSDFWTRSMQQLVRNTITLLMLAEEEITLDKINQIIVSAPLYANHHEDEKWREESFCWQCLQKARGRDRDAHLSTIESHDFAVCSCYWLTSFASLADRTRTGITATFDSLADMLLHGEIWNLLCTETTITPDEAGTPSKVFKTHKTKLISYERS